MHIALSHSFPRSTKLAAALCAAAFMTGGAALAQQMANPYGPNINLASAKKVAAAGGSSAQDGQVAGVGAAVLQ